MFRPHFVVSGHDVHRGVLSALGEDDVNDVCAGFAGKNLRRGKRLRCRHRPVKGACAGDLRG